MHYKYDHASGKNHLLSDDQTEVIGEFIQREAQEGGLEWAYSPRSGPTYSLADVQMIEAVLADLGREAANEHLRDIEKNDPEGYRRIMRALGELGADLPGQKHRQAE